MSITNEQLTESGTKSSQAVGAAGQLAAGEYTIGDILKERVQEAYDYNSDIVDDLDIATSEYTSAPSVGREKYQNIFNPFQRESLVSQYVGNKSIPMLSFANILGNRMGRIDDMVGAGTRAYQAQSAQANALAQMKRQQYVDMQNQYELEENKRRWEIEQTAKANAYRFDPADFYPKEPEVDEGNLPDISNELKFVSDDNRQRLFGSGGIISDIFGGGSTRPTNNLLPENIQPTLTHPGTWEPGIKLNPKIGGFY